MAKNNPDTEKESLYANLEKMSTEEILMGINAEDKKVSSVIKKQIPNIEKLVDAVVVKMQHGGRLFYIGAGTSGRIGILEADSVFCLCVNIHFSPSIPMLICDFVKFLTSMYAKPVKQLKRNISRTKDNLSVLKSFSMMF